MEVSKSQNDAAGDLVEEIAKTIGENRAIHPATAISSCARISGSLLYRSFELSVSGAVPGNVVLSEEANQKGPTLINILAWMLSNFGIEIDKQKMQTIQKEDSKIGFIDTINLLQEAALRLMEKYNLDFEQMAISAAMATAFIIKECKDNLPIETGFQTAIYSFIEGTKTFPPDFFKKNGKDKPWFKFW